MRHLACHSQEVPQKPPLPVGRAPGRPSETVREGTEARPQTSSHLCPPAQAVMYPCAHQAQACTCQLSLSLMVFNCGFWQMLSNLSLNLAREGYGVTFWEFWEISVRF